MAFILFKAIEDSQRRKDNNTLIKEIQKLNKWGQYYETRNFY